MANQQSEMELNKAMTCMVSSNAPGEEPLHDLISITLMRILCKLNTSDTTLPLHQPSSPSMVAVGDGNHHRRHDRSIRLQLEVDATTNRLVCWPCPFTIDSSLMLALQTDLSKLLRV
jgi:hypothetical protein